ncbi:uncharacterized protein LOC141702152, partial [Apium graveolens]|uniref:uncharacterized protein LOC141702152 n=1 Tax=Apium graveolens TaxID=4045 RepID=UPI003D7B0D0E
FLEAELGHNPSYVWRSILEAQTLLKRARWRIGDGHSISVMGQPWLSEVQNPFITTQHIALQGAKVHSLFKTDTKVWDEEIIEDLFEARDRKAIYDSVVQESRGGYSYWFPEHNGHYSVKSAYKLLQTIQGRWDVNMDANIWRSLWRAQERRPQTTVFHCMFAKNCWHIVCPEANFDSSMNIHTWFLYVVKHLTGKMAMISMVCWSIWKARNDEIWNNRKSRAGNVVSNAIAYLSQWKDVQKMGNNNLPRPGNSTGSLERWSKPDIGCVKVNCDATIFNNSNQFGVGWIVRDERGKLVHAACLSFQGKPEVHFAEAVGMREALSWVKSELDNNRGSSVLNLQHQVIVETDCQIV